MIKSIISLLLVLFILFFYCKIRNIENFIFKTEQSCIDNCILNKTSICSSADINCKRNKCIDFCKKNGPCDNDLCIYKKKVDLENNPPEAIDYPNIKFFREYIYLSWFKPETYYKDPILKYIIVIEDNNTKETMVQFINNNNNNLVKHNINGLTNNNTYNIKIYSENNNGKSKPLEINNLFYPSKEFVINGNVLTLGKPDDTKIPKDINDIT